MKKTTLAIGIVAVLGIGYVGTAWYTGNVIKNNIDNKLEQLTEEVNHYQDKFNMMITQSNYEKSLFSTKLHLTITLSPKDTDSSEVEPQKIFDDDLTIHHGPFPIAALSNGTFSPQMAWIEYKMTEQASPELWKLAGNQPFLTGYASLSYGQYLKIKLNNKAISADKSDLNDIDNNLDISKGDFSFESNKDFTSIYVNAHLGNLTYSENNNDLISLNKFDLTAEPNLDQTSINYEFNFGHIHIDMNDSGLKENIDINDFNVKGNYNYESQDLDVESSIDKFTYKPDMTLLDKIPSVEINKLVMNQKNSLTSTNTLDGSIVTNIGSLILGQQNLGTGVFDIEFRGIDKNLLPNNFDEIYHEEADLTAENKLFNMKVTLNKFNWHNADGDIDVSGLIDLSDVNSNDLSVVSVDKINALKLNINAPLTVLSRLSAQLDNPKESEVTSEQINKASLTVLSLSDLLFNNSPIVTFSKDNIDGIFTDIDYAKDHPKVKVNDQTFNKEEFFNNL